MGAGALRKAALLFLLLPACSPAGESAAPPEPSAAAASSSSPTPGFLARQGKTESLTCFPELPPGAEDALRAVRDAAGRGDFQALRGWLADDVNWSFGATPGAEGAIAEWRKKPQILRELVAVLDRGCLADTDSALVSCPPEHTTAAEYLGWRAGFARRGPAWRMVFFVAGD